VTCDNTPGLVIGEVVATGTVRSPPRRSVRRSPDRAWQLQGRIGLSTSLDRAAARGRLHRIALAGLASATITGLALLGTAAVAAAQQPGDATVDTVQVEQQQGRDKEKPPAEQPEQPELFVDAGCEAPKRGDQWVGYVDVEVTNPNKKAVTYTVTLKTDPEQSEEVKVKGDDAEFVSFGNVPTGTFEIVVTGDDGTTASSEAKLDRCGEISDPVDDELQVFVRCADGRGLVTIYLFNLGRETRALTVSVDDIEQSEPVELDGGAYLVYIDEEPTEDGTYVVRVTGEGVDTEETVTVACAPAPEPSTTQPSTTAPPAQGGPVPSDGLAATGAAVGGVAVLGVIALVLGAALVLIGRRRVSTGGSDG